MPLVHQAAAQGEDHHGVVFTNDRSLPRSRQTVGTFVTLLDALLSTHPADDALLNQVWGYDYYGDARTVDVHVGTLRKKVEVQPSAPRWIKTVWGIGYKFEHIPADADP
jgi:DNA-binding response OmpR family regulator